MPSILRKPSHTARLPRNGHDMSRRVLFTSSVGHIIPVMYDYLDAGDRVYINDNLFTRTQPVKTPAFIRCKEHVYYFFVPISQIDTYHGLAKYNIRDVHNTNDASRNMFSNVPSSLPYSMPLFALYNLELASIGYYAQGSTNYQSQVFGVYNEDSAGGYVFNLYLNENYFQGGADERHQVLTDSFGIPTTWNAFRLLDMLGYGSFHLTQSKSSARVLPYLLAVYQKIWYDFFRISTWTPNYPYAYNLNSCIKDGSFGTLLQDVASAGVDSGTWVNNKSILDLHYHPLKKDFFTNVLPSPLSEINGANSYGAGNTPNTSGFTSVGSLLTSAYGVNLQMPVNEHNNPFSRNNFGIDSDGENARYEIENTSSGNQYLAVSQLRFLYAYDRFLAITQRAGKHYDDQVLAHLGVKIPEGVSGESYYLGCHSNNLIIGEVVGTAAGSDGDGSTSVLGELAGRGLGASRKNKRIKFRAPDDGFLMALYCCVPDVDYKDYGVNRINLYNSIMDWPRPEFDRLGMQPLYNFQSSTMLGSFVSGDYANSGVSQVIGWQYRWSELKLTYDIVHGAFNHTLSDWTSSIFFGQFGNVEHNLYCPPTYLDGVFAFNFLPAKQSVDGVSVRADSILLSSQHVDELPSSVQVDTVLEHYTPDWNGDSSTMEHAWNSSIMYSRDPLLHSIDFDYKKVSWMSTYGLPNI